MKNAYIYLQNGDFIKAKSFGADGTTIGEIVFNTSLSGYQEVITDPSYAGQFIVFTMPEIGIVGTNDQDLERESIHAKGVFIRNYNEFYSNFRANSSLGDFLKKNNTMGLCNIDTRALTKLIREQGTMMAIASTTISSKDELAKMLQNSNGIEEINYIKEVSTKMSFKHTQGAYSFDDFSYTSPKVNKKVVAIDFGAKLNILNELVNVGLDVEVRPHNFDATKIIEEFDRNEVSGVFLSNGPGNPMLLKDEIEQIKKLIAHKIPIFGICLGHQLLSIAHGYETIRLKFGHHGGNHPVKNLSNGKVEITSQNHNYALKEDISQIAEITHRNLFDGTIEGVKYKDSPIFSVQHHPEASPGPREASILFVEFARMLESI